MRGRGGHQKVTSLLNVKKIHDFLKEKNNEYIEESSALRFQLCLELSSKRAPYCLYCGEKYN